MRAVGFGGEVDLNEDGGEVRGVGEVGMKALHWVGNEELGGGIMGGEIVG